MTKQIKKNMKCKESETGGGRGGDKHKGVTIYAKILQYHDNLCDNTINFQRNSYHKNGTNILFHYLCHLYKVVS